MSTPKRTESPPLVRATIMRYDPEITVSSQIVIQNKSTGAESPTTARPLEMDDDDVQDATLLNSEQATAPAAPAAVASQTTPAAMEAAPPKPPRPLNPQQEAENTLKEAFPGVDAAVVKAVLVASGGRIEPAFNALLGMTDPNAAVEVEAPAPPQPPRPARGGANMSQLEADELYARQLAQHYDASQQLNTSRSGGRNPSRGQNLRPNELRDDDENYSFIDDELPVIKENLRKGFLETQSKVNSWITNFKKRIDGDDIGEIHAEQERHAQGYQSQQQYGSRRGETGRRSGDSGRYDADPHVLSGDFSGMQLNDDTSELHHIVTPRSSSLPNSRPDNVRRSTRPLANPDLFKPTPATPRSNDGRRVSFQNGPPEDIDLYGGVVRTGNDSAPASGKQSKWQPLSAVDPSPANEADNDPFSLGDSEDENPTKERAGSREVNKEDAERLKRASSAAEPVEHAVKPEPAETVGTKDKIADDKLAGKDA